MNLSRYETMDVHLLLGLINTALRNECVDLDDLVARYDLNRERLCDRLREIGMTYHSDINQFRPGSEETLV